MKPDTKTALPHTLAVLPMALWITAVATAVAPASAQDANILLHVDTIEKRLAYDDFEIIDRRGSRFEGDRTDRVAMSYPDGTMLLAKWAIAPSGGEMFNNNPRYELAAYEIQKLFLEPNEYVVPPTVVRAFPLSWYRELDEDAEPTFRNTDGVLVVLQYWLFNIAGNDFWDEDRFATDSVYARHMGNFNILTYAIRHNDQNVGNYLISGVEEGPRVFSVDNGLAFESRISDQGARWRRIRVDSLPAETIERLRDVTEEDLHALLATLAQFRVQPDGALAREPAGPAMNEDRGVRHEDELIQFGLTRREIGGVWRRIESLLGDVDDGDIGVF